MPCKSAFAATLVACLGLPAAAQAMTLPGSAVSSPQGFVLVQQDRGDRASVLRNELDAAKGDLEKAKKSGRGVEAAKKRVEQLEDAMAKALGNEPNRGGGGKLGVKDDGKNNKNKKKADDNDKDKKKAEDRDGGKDNDSNKRKADGRDTDNDRKKADRDGDNDKNKKKADDRNRDNDNDRKKADDRGRDNDRKKVENRDGDRDRDDNRRAGRGDGDRDRDGVREGNKTSARELSNKRIEEGKQAVIDGGDRVLRREGGRVVVRSDDRDRFDDGRRRDERLDGGRTRVVIDRPDGTQVITVRDSDGDIVRRVRRTRDGREIVLIDEDQARRNDRDRDRGRYDDRDRRGGDWDRDNYRGRDGDRDFRVELGPLRITIPRDRYIVEQRHASRRDLEEALTAPPMEPVEHYYTLDDVRRSDRLRDKMRRIDVSSITFDTDSAAISRSQIDTLEELGYVLGSIIERNPDEVFLIEGHTDAVGSEVYNLALSDRRAESVAIALSDYFRVPPENLVTQGYGEYYLKIPTPYDERENRRVTVRRITPLIRTTQR